MLQAFNRGFNRPEFQPEEFIRLVYTLANRRGKATYRRLLQRVDEGLYERIKGELNEIDADGVQAVVGNEVLG